MPSSLTPLLTSNIHNTSYDKFRTRTKTEKKNKKTKKKTWRKEEQDAVYNAKNFALHRYSSVRNATTFLKLNDNAAATK